MFYILVLGPTSVCTTNFPREGYNWLVVMAVNMVLVEPVYFSLQKACKESTCSEARAAKEKKAGSLFLLADHNDTDLPSQDDTYTDTPFQDDTYFLVTS